MYHTAFAIIEQLKHYHEGLLIPNSSEKLIISGSCYARYVRSIYKKNNNSSTNQLLLQTDNTSIAHIA